MPDFYLDPITGDLAIENGDIRLTTGLESVRQLLDLRMSASVGEWEFDLDYGVDYFGKILGHSPSIEELTTIFRKVIIETDGIDKINSLIITISAKRVLTVTYEAIVLGEVITGELVV